MIVLVIVALFFLFELTCFILMVYIKKRFGIIFFSKNHPQLSKFCRQFYRNFLQANGIGKINEFHSELGWIIRADLYDSDGNRLTTKGRARNDIEFDSIPDEKQIRIATYGDCLTYGYGLQLEDTWQKKIEKLNNSYEVLNFGTEAYDPGQLYLRYINSLRYYQGFKFTIFSVVSTNIFKPLNIFRPFYAYDHGLPLGKPGFVLKNNQLNLIPNPLQKITDYNDFLLKQEQTLLRIGKDDYYFEKKYKQAIQDILPSSRLFKVLYHEFRKFQNVFELNGILKKDSAAFSVSAAILEKIHTSSLANKSIPVFLFLPIKKDFEKYLNKKIKSYQPFIELCEEKQFAYIDILEELKIDSLRIIEKLFDGIHYTSYANGLIANSITKHLSELTEKL